MVFAPILWVSARTEAIFPSIEMDVFVPTPTEDLGSAGGRLETAVQKDPLFPRGDREKLEHVLSGRGVLESRIAGVLFGLSDRREDEKFT
jgi:hypothetical protein